MLKKASKVAGFFVGIIAAASTDLLEDMLKPFLQLLTPWRLVGFALSVSALFGIIGHLKDSLGSKEK